MQYLLLQIVLRIAAYMICLTFVSAPVFSQNGNLKFERISLLQGLSQNTVTSIIQDREGYLWFATLDGLNKYDGYKFTVYKHLPSDSNSLSSNIIWSLYQDKSGYIWVGTVASGLNRFDPQTETFFHFYHDPADPNSLSDNRVRAICEDGDGFLWIGTRDTGLNKYDAASGKFIHYKHDPQNTNSLSHNHIRTILPDDDGILWIGTSAGGLNRFDPKTDTWVRFMIEPNNPHSLNHNHVESLCRDSEGVLWVGTYGGGLNRLVHTDDLRHGKAEETGYKQKTEFIHYTHDDEDPSSISGDVIESVFEDHDGVLWIGTNSGGLNRFDRETETFITYKNEQNNPNGLSFNNVETIFEDASFNLWVGTWGGGLNKLDRKGAKFVHYVSQPNDLNSLCNNYVRAIAREPSGILWVGTSGGGLDRIDREASDFSHYRYEPDNPNSLSSNDVRSIHIDDDATLWVGTYGGGLNRISLTEPQNRTTGAAQPQLKFKHYKHEPGNPNSLCNDYVWTVHEDSDGIVWLGTNAGFNRFDPRSESFVHYKHEPGRQNSLSSNIVRVILEDHTGSLWLGTYNGLNKFDPESEEFTVYFHEGDNENSLSHSSVMSICETEPGILWFGTLGGGLNKFDVKNGTFDHYFESDGLPNSFVHTIISADNGQLWLSTNNGLSRFDDRLPAGQKFRNYDVHDGLQSNEFNVGAGFKDKSGELFFGGVNGLNCFYPDRIKDNPHVPAVVITDFKIFNEQVTLDSAVMNTKEIKLSYEDRFFSFEFAALDYTFPGKNQYAYKMEGFDSDWICSGSRRYAGYTNLDPGEYVFKVKGSNNDGLWNEEGASIRIKITPPFWQTWWFRVLALVSTMSLLAFIYRQRVAQLRKAKKTQEEFSKRLIEIQETERQRIASELHDGLGQELLVINQGLQQAAGTLPAGSVTRKDLEQISETTLDAINEVREISSNLHPHQLDRLGLKKAIESMAHRLAQSSNININLELEDLPGFFGKNEEINIYRIIQEGLNNILKHSGADNVLIQFTRSRRAVKLLIQDDGKGFRPKVFDSDLENIQGFGLTNISERVKMLSGKLAIDSSPGHGTTLKIEIHIHPKNRILQ